MNKNMIYSGLIAAVVSLLCFGGSHFIQKDHVVKIEHVSNIPGHETFYTYDSDGNSISLDFNKTAEQVIKGVVHIKSTYLFDQQLNNRNIPDPFRHFFGDEFQKFFGPDFKFEEQRPNYKSPPPTRVGSGSGVIINDQGYIITNNHVVANADDVEVTLHDNRVYKAAIVGTDPSTDLALIQIKEKDLPTIPLVDSDQVQIGQWVLAVGNPMGLTSTVTAGIVSATGRNINILRDKYAIENFIQTDAAINPGNSGGALVNLNGGLIGINTAIASPTGSFAGYGFAVPTNIVQKVIEDLIEYGVVQRGVLGVMIRTVDGSFSKEKGLELNQGVYVDSLLENSAGEISGIQVGDVITSVNNIDVKTSAELQGMIARYRPGEKVSLGLNRFGEVVEIDVVLKNKEGEKALLAENTSSAIHTLGAEFEEIDKSIARKLEINSGIKVKKLRPGKLRKYTQMREGFIITKVDGQEISSIEDLSKVLDKKEGGVMLEGVYEDIPGVYYYAFGL